MPSLFESVGTGVITGQKVITVFDTAKKHGFAIPAVNVTTSSTANAVMEAARDLNSPIILQMSNGGAAFFAGKGIKNTNQKASVAGAVAAAQHIRAMAKFYEIPVILHTDHCAKNLLPWFDGMVTADEEYFAIHGEPLFSSHMLDLSEESDEENIETCKMYFERLNKINCFLEMEIGITGGEEDGVDNSGVDMNKLYTTPEQIWNVYSTLSAIAPSFSIAAAFGNVHGVYKPGNVVLNPSILGDHQTYVQGKLEEGKTTTTATTTTTTATTTGDKPCYFVFHGGSGSSKAEIATAVSHGVVKMNIDTDTQWSYWKGIKEHDAKFHDYLQGQIGNPEGADKPNKKKYDPRVWLRAAEVTMTARVKQACEDLGNVGTLSLEI